MTDEDPQQLKSAGGTPAEIVRALRALGSDDRDAARLARVAEQLGAKLAASGAPTGWLHTLTGTKLGLTGLLLGVGALGALGYTLTANREAPSAEVPSAPAPVVANPPQEPALARPSEPVPAEAEAAEAPASVQERPRAAQPADRSHTRPRRGGVRASGGVNVAARIENGRSPTPEPGPANAAEPTPANTHEPSKADAPEPTRADTPEPVQARTQPTPADVKPPAPAPAPKPQRSEVALLHDARKFAIQEPEAALRLLDEHAKRFPNGMLVPEREVLAIEVLRRLGRDAEAERRLRRFESRYPGSIHLRRLERSPSGAGSR